MMDGIVIAVLVCIIGGVCLYLYRAKKRGETCIGCPYGKQCAHCGKGACHPEENPPEDKASADSICDE